MTLNGHFGLKSGSSSACNELAFWLSEKTLRKFAELRIYCQRQKNVAQLGTVLLSYGVIQWNNRTESVKPVNSIYSFALTVVIHALH